jgi:FtsP/CotA-like multicopper oxidase with cupredoxin domain
VLTYADVYSIDRPVVARESQREIELRLKGHMQRFVWSFDGQKYSDSKPIALRYGELAPASRGWHRTGSTWR